MMSCCTGPRQKQKRLLLPHGSVVEGEGNTLDVLKRSMNSIHEASSNGGVWTVKLSENVKNSNVWAVSVENAKRLAQWYAYLDYKDLKARINNDPDSPI